MYFSHFEQIIEILPHFAPWLSYTLYWAPNFFLNLQRFFFNLDLSLANIGWWHLNIILDSMHDCNMLLFFGSSLPFLRNMDAFHLVIRSLLNFMIVHELQTLRIYTISNVLWRDTISLVLWDLYT